MYIKNAKAFYGKLDSAEISFKKGLNVVYASNEAGKTTWCSFFKTMLYGINTQERDHAGFLSVKTKYEPWQGSGMRGSMDVNFQDHDITLERTALAKAPMRNLHAVYTGTDTHIRELETENCGEILTGVSKSVFEKSAFIESGRLNVSAGAELEHKINALVSGGDEENAMSEADAILAAAQKKLKSRNSGLIPELKEEIAKAKEELSGIKTSTGRIFTLQNELTAEEEEQAILEKEVVAHQYLSKKKRFDDIEKCEKDLAELSEVTVKTENELAELSHAGKDEAADLRVRLAHLAEYTETSELYKTKAAEAADAAQRYASERDNYIFRSNTAEGLEAEIEDYKTERTTALKSSADAHKNANIFGILAVAMILAGIAGVVTHIWLLCIAFAVAACFAGLYFKNINKSDEYLKTSDDVLARLGFATEQELEEKKNEYHDFMEKSEQLTEENERAQLAYESTLAVLSDNRNDILEAAGKIKPIQTVEEAAALADTIDEVNDEAEKQQRLTEMLTNKLAFLKEAVAQDGEVLPEPEDLVTPRYPEVETKERRADSAEKMKKLQSAYDMEKGRIGAFEDPLLLESKIVDCSEKLAKAEEDYDTIALAREALADADAEIQRRFSPILSQKAGAIFHLLTGGKYDMLAFNKSFDANAVEHGDAVGRNILYMSNGTADQIYLALRLAIAELVLKGEESCPIILDDALICFDEERMAFALDYLKELAKERQIILFSCHKREYAYFENVSEVNTISL